MLLDDVVAAQPGEVVPVAHLVLHLGLVLLVRLEPEHALVPVAAAGRDVADFAAVDALHRFEVAGLVAPLRAGDDRAGPFPWPSRRLPARRGCPGRRCRRGFSVKMFLPAATAARRWIGPEAGRRGQHDVIDVRHVDQLLVGVQADEAALLGMSTLLPSFLTSSSLATLFMRPLRQPLRRSSKASARAMMFDVGGGVHDVVGGAAAAAAAADQADLDGVRAGRRRRRTGTATWPRPHWPRRPSS